MNNALKYPRTRAKHGSGQARRIGACPAPKSGAVAKWQRDGLQNHYAGVRFPPAPPSDSRAGLRFVALTRVGDKPGTKPIYGGSILPYLSKSETIGNKQQSDEVRLWSDEGRAVQASLKHFALQNVRAGVQFENARVAEWYTPSNGAGAQI